MASIEKREARPERLVIVGGGNMARAIVGGAVRGGVARPSKFIVCEPRAEQRAMFEREPYAARVERVAARASELAGGLGPTDQILLAVKPQSLGDVAADLAPLLGGARRVVVTILAGTPSAKVRAMLGAQVAVVRAMPNLAASIGKGITAVCLGEGAAVGDDAVALALFRGCGEVVRIEERLMDAFTALAGSGPAYVFYLAEAMARAAEEMGLDGETADAVVRRVVEGSGAMLAGSSSTAKEWRDAVTSKAGTTAAATRVLEEAGVMETIVRAIVAARDRGAELARGG